MNKSCPACRSQTYKFFARKNGYELMRCLSCRTIFVAEPPEDTAEIYGKNYFWGASSGFGYVDYDADKEPMRRTFVSTLEQLETTVPEKSLLDVGGATGFFMNIAKSRGWKVSGVELGAHAAQAARDKGLEMITGTIADISPNRKFGVVTMFDVIEHVKEPRADLAKAKSLLLPGGMLVLITPDSGSLYARLMGKRWHLIVPPEHLSYFNRKSLKNLLEDVGFEVVEISAPAKSFTVEYILHTLLRWQKLSIWRGLFCFVRKHPKLANLCLPINFHDNMFLSARVK